MAEAMVMKGQMMVSLRLTWTRSISNYCTLIDSYFGGYFLGIVSIKKGQISLKISINP